MFHNRPTEKAMMILSMILVLTISLGYFSMIDATGSDGAHPKKVIYLGDEFHSSPKEDGWYYWQFNETNLTYSFKEAPAGATIDNRTGEIRWRPSKADLGYNDMDVLVTDGNISREIGWILLVKSKPQEIQQYKLPAFGLLFIGAVLVGTYTMLKDRSLMTPLKRRTKEEMPISTEFLSQVVLILSIIGSGIYSFLGMLAFNMTTDATAIDGSFGLLNTYILTSAIFYIPLCFGLAIVTLLTQVRIKARGWCASFFLLLSALMLLPSVNTSGVMEFFALLPTLGMCAYLYSMGTSVITGQKKAHIVHIKWILIIQVIITFVLLFSYEYFQTSQRATGAIVILAMFVILGVLMLGEGFLVYHAIRIPSGVVVDKEVKARSAKPEPKKSPSRQKYDLTNPVPFIALVAMLFLVMFLPPIERLVTEPDVEIFDAKINGNMLKVTVINKGGMRADGGIGLIVSNSTVAFFIKGPDGIDGFEKWVCEKDVRLLNFTFNGSIKKQSLNVTLSYSGKLVDFKRAHPPTSCAPFIPMILLSVMMCTYVNGRKKQRDRSFTE